MQERGVGGNRTGVSIDSTTAAKNNGPKAPNFQRRNPAPAAARLRVAAGTRCCDLAARVRCILVGKVVQKQVPKRQSLGDARVYSELPENVLRIICTSTLSLKTGGTRGISKAVGTAAYR